jgi:hypothetical protein
MLFEYTSPRPEFRVSYQCVILLRELLVDGPGFGMVSFSGKIAFCHRAQAIIFEIICRHGDSPLRSGSIVMSLRCRIAQFGIGATILIPDFPDAHTGVRQRESSQGKSRYLRPPTLGWEIRPGSSPLNPAWSQTTERDKADGNSR